MQKITRTVWKQRVMISSFAGTEIHLLILRYLLLIRKTHMGSCMNVSGTVSRDSIQLKIVWEFNFEVIWALIMHFVLFLVLLCNKPSNPKIDVTWSVKDIDLSFCYKPEVYPMFKIPVVNLDRVLNKHRLYLLRSYGDLRWFRGFKTGRTCVQRLVLPYLYWYCIFQPCSTETENKLTQKAMMSYIHCWWYFQWTSSQLKLHWPLVVWEFSSIYSIIEILGEKQSKWITQICCWTKNLIVFLNPCHDWSLAPTRGFVYYCFSLSQTWGRSVDADHLSSTVFVILPWA